MVLLFQIYFWYTYDHSHTNYHSSHAKKSPIVPPADQKIPVVLPTVKKKAVLLISRYRNQFIYSVPG